MLFTQYCIYKVYNTVFQLLPLRRQPSVLLDSKKFKYILNVLYCLFILFTQYCIYKVYNTVSLVL